VIIDFMVVIVDIVVIDIVTFIIMNLVKLVVKLTVQFRHIINVIIMDKATITIIFYM